MNKPGFRPGFKVEVKTDQLLVLNDRWVRKWSSTIGPPIQKVCATVPIETGMALKHVDMEQPTNTTRCICFISRKQKLMGGANINGSLSHH